MIHDYTQFLNESLSPDSEKFTTFASNRLAGASKISSAAKDKGGDAMLTYHHFKVKLPYYKKAVEGKFSPQQAELELDKKLKDLVKGLSGDLKLTQTQFQVLMGEIEVIGELLIKNQK